MEPKFDVFISYSRQDRAFVDKLVTDLQDHQLRVWLDRLEIKPGEQFRQCIEDGIEKSRFLCFVISNASLKSYVARKVELESAFAKMMRENRTDFILPLRLRSTRKLPLQLSTHHYLDFSSPKSYMTNLKKLVKRISQTDENFTGSRLYKNVDTSMTGTMVGVGEPLRQPPYRGSFVRVFFDRGRIKTMETYSDGKPDAAKSVLHDAKGRVSEIVLFRDNQVIDTWRYQYHPRTGLRQFKWVHRPGFPAHERFEYDRKGNKTTEARVNQTGKLVNGPEGWATKRFVRDAENPNTILRYEYLNAADRLLRTEEA